MSWNLIYVCIIFILIYIITNNKISLLVLALILIWPTSMKSIISGGGHKIKIGKGDHSVVYKEKRNGKWYVVKVGKQSILRQKLFQEKVAIYHPKRFTQLVSYENNTLVSTPLLTKKFKLPIDWKPMFEYLLESVRIMNKAGFYHRDIHEGNIMGDSYGNWYLIDYGNLGIDGEDNDIDKEIKLYWSSDVIQLIWVFLPNPVWDTLDQNNLPKFEDMIQRIKEYPKYNEIVELMPIGEKSELMFNQLLCLIACVKFYDVYCYALGVHEYDFVRPDVSYWINLIGSIYHFIITFIFFKD
jgi:predicted Ser/Thr protein kinase